MRPDLVEALAWTLIWLIGFGIVSRNLIDAIGDFYYLKGSGHNGQLRIEAYGAIWAEALRAAAAAIFLALGLISLISRSALAWVFVAAMFGAAVLLVSQSGIDRRTRRMILRYRGVNKAGPPLDLFRE